MSHTLVLENLPPTKWNRYPWSTQLAHRGVGIPRACMPTYEYGVHPGAYIDEAFLKWFS